MDEVTTLYPSEGEGVLTGAEYVLAKEQGCEVMITEAFLIPMKSKIDRVDGQKKMVLVDKPFFNVIKSLQAERRKHPKGTINNLLYKELGNSIYGLTAKGIANKRKFDIKVGKTVRMEGNDLSNPIIAS